MQNQISKLEPAGARREVSRPTHVDRAVDRPVDRGVDMPVDLPVDRGAPSFEPGCTRLHQVAPGWVSGWLGGLVLEIS